jgi:hypothetical protein
MPGQKLIRWDRTTLEQILQTRQKLEDMGMVRPSIRSVLYALLSLPDWKKSHYDTLCVKLGEWRDAGKVPWGLFADDGGGASYRPMTDEEIHRRIQALEGAMRPSLARDGALWGIFVEHIGLVDTLASWTDYRVPVVSSQGQLRREHLYSAISSWYDVAKKLNAVEVRCLALVDYDRAGHHIYNAHEAWLKRIFGLKPKMWAVTSDQAKAAGLDWSEDHQLDGWMAAYGPQKVRTELRKALKFAS